MTTITSIGGSGNTTIAAPATYTNPVASSTKLAGLSSTAAKLGQDASVIATLGGNTSTTPLYNAVGLLNSYIQADANNTAQSGSGTSTTGSTVTGNTATGSTAGNNAGTSAGTTAGTGTGSTSATDINANWATILKANPALAGTVAADSTLQGIVSTISTTA